VKVRDVSDETDQPQTLTGKARSLASLRPFKKGGVSNPKGRPKDLARFGDILMGEFYKTVPASLAGNLIDFERVREGIILTIRRSKTDQDGVGRRVGVPFGRTIHCPVRALRLGSAPRGSRTVLFSGPSIDTGESRQVDSQAKLCP
jgi:hypothetical protein